jgi:outer membrane protein assembly factor BamB
VAHSPTVVGDQLFIGSCNGLVHSLNRRTGQVRWEADVRPEGDTSMYAFHGDPLITERLVIIGVNGTAGGVYALDRLTGSIRWKYPAGRGIDSAVVGLGRNAYATTIEGQLICVDVDSGRLRWSFSVDFPGFKSPTVIDGRVIFGSRDGNVYALDGGTGKVVWKKALGDAISTSVAAHGSDLYLGTLMGWIYRLRAEDGTVVSSIRLDSGPSGMPLQVGESLLVFLVDREGNYHSLVCLDRSLKLERWRQKTDRPRNWAASRLLVWGDCVVVGTSAGEVIAFNLRDGSQSWRQAVEGHVRSIADSGDTIYFGTTEGTIYAYVPPERANK